MRRLALAFGLFILGSWSYSQTTPKELWGKWSVSGELPTQTISCWGEAEAKSLLGPEIEYSTTIFRWKQSHLQNPVATTKTGICRRISQGKFWAGQK
jgi:hypothetical protein